MSKSPSIGPPWTILKLLNWTQAYFDKRGIPAPRFEAELLLADTLGIERLQLYLRFDQPVMESELQAFREVVKRRAAGEPVAYLTGKKAFYSIELACDRRALIPRNDTETLVDVVLSRMPERAETLIDVGTGTGAIGLALATEQPNLKVIVTDLSVDALDLAKKNVESLDLTQRVGLLRGDLLEAVPKHRTFEVVVSNPPYISEKTRKEVTREVNDFEPHLALYAGEDGLDVIKPLTKQAFERLPSGGLFAIEIGFDQGEIVPELFEQTGFSAVELNYDLNNLPRVVSGIVP